LVIEECKGRKLQCITKSIEKDLQLSYTETAYGS